MNKKNLGNPSDSSDRSSHADAGAASIRVLIIDDDETMRDAIGYILEDLGIGFDAVGSGEQGLEKLDERSYDLVFLDLVLHTGSHGIEIYSKIRKLQQNLTIVLMTASASREPIFEEAVKLQQPILRKPFSLDEIEQIIGKLIEKLD